MYTVCCLTPQLEPAWFTYSPSQEPSDIRIDFRYIGKALSHAKERSFLTEVLCKDSESEGSSVSEAIAHGETEVLAIDIDYVGITDQLSVNPVKTYKCTWCHLSTTDIYSPEPLGKRCERSFRLGVFMPCGERTWNQFY